MSKIIRLGLDLDDVLVETSAYLEEHLKEKFDFLLTDEQRRSHSRYDELPGLPEHIVKEVRTVVFEPEFLMRVPPTNGAIEATQYLKRRGVSIHIISARLPENFIFTNEYLKKHGFSFDSLTCCGRRRYKPKLAFGLRLDAFIDDDFTVLQLFSSFRNRPREWKLAVYNRPWNEDSHEKNISRIKDWEDLYRFANLSRKR